MKDICQYCGKENISFMYVFGALWKVCRFCGKNQDQYFAWRHWKAQETKRPLP